MEEESLHVGNGASLGDGCLGHQLVQLLVIAYRQLNVSWRNGLLLVLISGIPSKLKDLTGEVLEDCGCENASTDTDLVSVATLLDVAGHPTNGEDQVASLARGDCGLSFLHRLSSFSCHLEICLLCASA